VAFSNIMNSISTCRTYIVYRHALFASGVRSILEERKGVQIGGMDDNIGKALKAVRFLRPDVILLEEPSEKEAEWPFLKSATAGRVVTLSLDHGFATVYDQHRIPASDPGELIRAIQGGGRQQVPTPNPPHPKAATLLPPEAGPNGGEVRSGKKSRVRRTPKEEASKAQDMPRAPRARKGG
jgi:hypothetical protein